MNVWLFVWSCAVYFWLKDFMSGWSPVGKKKKKEREIFDSGKQWTRVGNCSLTPWMVLLAVHHCSASCGSVQFQISNENLKQSLQLRARLGYFCPLWAKPFFPRSLTGWFCSPWREWPPEWVGIGWALPQNLPDTAVSWSGWGNAQMTVHPSALLRILQGRVSFWYPLFLRCGRSAAPWNSHVRDPVMCLSSEYCP